MYCTAPLSTRKGRLRSFRDDDDDDDPLIPDPQLRFKEKIKYFEEKENKFRRLLFGVYVVMYYSLIVIKLR